MRKQINTMNDVTKAYKEIEIKSAVCVGLDYGFEVEVSRTYRGTIVRLREMYVDCRKWDIEEITIQFLNESNMNSSVDGGADLRNKIRVLHTGHDVKGSKEKKIFKEDIFETWDKALSTIMETVWMIENE